MRESTQTVPHGETAAADTVGAAAAGSQPTTGGGVRVTTPPQKVLTISAESATSCDPSNAIVDGVCLACGYAEAPASMGVSWVLQVCCLVALISVCRVVRFTQCVPRVSWCTSHTVYCCGSILSHSASLCVEMYFCCNSSVVFSLTNTDMCVTHSHGIYVGESPLSAPCPQICIYTFTILFIHVCSFCTCRQKTIV